MSLKKNFLYNLAYRIVNLIVPLITAPYVARILGAHSLGTYTLSQTFANYFVLFIMLGVANYGNRSIARTRDSKEVLSRTFWEIYSLQLFLGVVLSVIYVIVVSSIYSGIDKTIYLLQIFYVLSGGLDINWCCHGLENFKLASIRSMVVRIVLAVFTFAFVHSQSDLWIYTLLLSFGTLASVLILWPFIIKHVGFTKPNINGIISHIKPNLMLFLPVIAVSLYNMMDKLILGYMSNSAEVQFYQYAETIVQIPCTLILALDTVMMPRVSNMLVNNREKEILPLTDKVMTFAMSMGAASAFGLAAISDTFAPWFYGAEFKRTGLFIALLAPIIIFKSWAGVIRTQHIIPYKKDTIYLKSLTTGAVINLIADISLIPFLNGIGAIIGTILAEGSVCFVQFFCTRHALPFKKYLWRGVLFIGCGAVMYGCLSVVHQLFLPPIVSLIIQISVGGIIYLALCFIVIWKVLKDYRLINEVFRTLHIKTRLHKETSYE